MHIYTSLCILVNEGPKTFPQVLSAQIKKPGPARKCWEGCREWVHTVFGMETKSRRKTHVAPQGDEEGDGDVEGRDAKDADAPHDGRWEARRVKLSHIRRRAAAAAAVVVVHSHSLSGEGRPKGYRARMRSSSIVC